MHASASLRAMMQGACVLAWVAAGCDGASAPATSVVAPAVASEPCLPRVGAFTRIYTPPGDGRAWYINDHTIVRGRDGLWHMIGITGPEPADPLVAEVQLAHAVSPVLSASGWQARTYALTADAALGESVLWAPHVVEHAGTFFMFYAAGGDDRTRWKLRLARSPDLVHWQRERAALFEDGFDARDPFVVRIGARWAMYYTATARPDGGAHVVAYRTSDDLTRWSKRGIAYADASEGTSGGNTESPTLLVRDEGFYLWIGPRHDYVSTEVFFSRDPFRFAGPPLAEIPAHAAEVVRDLDGQEHVSRAGWEQGGLDLAPLRWACPAASSSP